MESEKIEIESMIDNVFWSYSYSEMKLRINDEIYVLKISRGDPKLREGLDNGQLMRLKGILDVNTKKIIEPSDIWVKLL